MSIIKIKDIHYNNKVCSIWFSRSRTNRAIMDMQDYEIDSDEIATKVLKRDISEIVFSGGDPMETPKQCWQLVRDVRKHDEQIPIVIETDLSEETLLKVHNFKVYLDKIVKYENISFVFRHQN